MKIHLEELKNSEVILKISLDEDQMTMFRKEATEELQKEVKIDGFRQGHAPMELLVKKIGEAAFMNRVLDHALSHTYDDAIREKSIRPLAYPKIEILEQDPLVYTAQVAVMPELKWKKSMEKFSIKTVDIKVSEKEVEEVLEQLRLRSTEWKTVERAAKKDDRVELDFAGFEDGKDEVLPGTEGKNHPLILGSGSFIPGFETGLEGMKAGEEKDLNLSFPKDYHSDEFKGKKVRFHVKVHLVEEPKMPELNDDFASEISGTFHKTMESLKEEIQAELLKKKKREDVMRQESDLIQALPDYLDADLPEVLIEREIDAMISKIKEDLKRRNKTWEEYEKEMASDKKDIRIELKKPAREQILIRMAIEELVLERKITVSKEEMSLAAEERLGQFPPNMRDMIAQRLKDGGPDYEYLMNELILEKLTETFVTKSA